jgi:hypothetical protein
VSFVRISIEQPKVRVASFGKNILLNSLQVYLAKSKNVLVGYKNLFMKILLHWVIECKFKMCYDKELPPLEMTKDGLKI